LWDTLDNVLIEPRIPAVLRQQQEPRCRRRRPNVGPRLALVGPITCERAFGSARRFLDYLDLYAFPIDERRLVAARDVCQELEFLIRGGHNEVEAVMVDPSDDNRNDNGNRGRDRERRRMTPR